MVVYSITENMICGLDEKGWVSSICIIFIHVI